MPRSADTPRDLLFGLLALQNGLIDQDQLVLAFRAWSRADGRAMAEILVDQGALDADDRDSIEGLASRHLKKHGDDPGRSVAALAASPVLLSKLAGIGDPDLDASVAGIGTTLTHDDDDPYRTAAPPVGTSTAGALRFRFLRPHARGGLGFVSVALDTELNREVALKQILERHADDPDRRTRFLIEAEITGGLEHPGIVPVYGLGSYLDGRPYYAMRLIRGRDLKEAIARFHADASLKSDPGARSLALRELLRRFVDVCNAIQYAHSRSILHRDIKPANIIVGDHGETLVVDWGLARPIGRPGEGPSAGERPLTPSSSASSTGSADPPHGTPIGTPSYMSPEQAAGDLDRHDTRSDVYGLGSTLYSLLTGRPPFEGRDVGAMLRAVTAGEFPHPLAIDPAIDPSLEAVCLKAMSREPADRYASPRDLADDIQRWAADEPVSARREPFARRARRWARYHRTAVTSASSAVLMALVGLVTVLAVQSKANRDLNAKNGQLTESNRLKDQANANLKEANDLVRSRNALLVEANARESRANVDLKAANERVQARFDLAQEAIQTFRATVTEDLVLKDERFHALRDKLLRSAAAFYGKLGALLEGQGDRRSRLSLADAYRDLGDLTAEIGVKPEALVVYRKSLAVRRELARGGDPGDVLGLAGALLSVGNLADETGDPAGALAAHREAGELAESRQWPAALAGEASLTLANSHLNIGSVIQRFGDPGKALESYGRALAIHRALAEANPTVNRFRTDLATNHNNIGVLLERTGELGRAMESYRSALAIRRGLAEANPDVTRFQADLANSHNVIGLLLSRTGEPAGALESFDRALAIRRGLVEANPAVTRFRTDLAETHNNIGGLLYSTGQPGRALESFGRALAIRRGLAEANPDVTRFQADLAIGHNNIGVLLDNTGQPARALESYGHALAIRRKLTEANPAIGEFQADLALSHNNIGFLLSRTGEPARALESYNRALAIQQKLTESNPNVNEYQSAMVRSLNNIGALLNNTGQSVKALESYDRALGIHQKLAEANPTVFEFQANLATNHNNIGFLLASIGQPGRALESFGRALAIEQKLAEANPAVTRFQADLARSHNNIGAMLDRMGEPAGAMESYGRAVAIQRKLAEANPDVIESQAALANSHHNIGALLGRIGEPAGARESYGRAVAIRRKLAEANPTIVSYQSELFNSLASFGVASAELGRGAEAIASLRQAIAMQGRLPRKPVTLYDLACYQSRLAGAALLPDSGLSADEASAEGDRAVTMLRRAVAAGYRDVRHMRANRNLDPIRSRPDFQSILLELAFPAAPFAP